MSTETRGDNFAGESASDVDMLVQRRTLLGDGSESSWKLTAAMSSMLLLLLILRLNRVFVPWILKLHRRRRSSWVSRVPLDVARELHRRPNTRLLCAGSCCLSSYGCQDHSSAAERFGDRYEDDDAESKSGNVGSPSHNMTDSIRYKPFRDASGLDLDDAEATDSERLLPESVQRWVSSVREEACRVPRRFDQSATTTAMSLAAVPESLEVDEYFKVRVAQEERHRASSRALPLVTAPRNIWRLFTFISLLVYWAILMTAMLRAFNFGTSEACLLAFSLFFTGIVAEWDVLFTMTNGSPPVWLCHAADNSGDSTPLINAPIVV